MHEKDVVGIIERHEVRKSWENLHNAIHVRLSQSANNAERGKNIRQIRKLQDIGLYLGIIK